MISGLLDKLRARLGRRKSTATAARPVIMRAGASATEGNADGSRVGVGYDAAVHGEDDADVLSADLDLETVDAGAPVATLEGAALPPRIAVETTVNGADPDDEPLDPVSPGRNLVDDMAHLSRDAAP